MAGFQGFEITWRADVFSGAPQHTSAATFGTLGINFRAQTRRLCRRSLNGRGRAPVPHPGYRGTVLCRLRGREDCLQHCQYLLEDPLHALNAALQEHLDDNATCARIRSVLLGGFQASRGGVFIK